MTNRRQTNQGEDTTYVLFSDFLFNVVAVLTIALFTFLVEERSANSDSEATKSQAKVEVDILQERLAKALSEADAASRKANASRKAQEIAEIQRQTAEVEASKAKSEAKKAQQEATAAKNGVRAAVASAAENRDQKLGELMKSTIELVIAVDFSASMAQWHDELKSTIAAISELFPRATNLQIGIIAYGPKSTEIYQLAPLRPTYEDGGASLGKITSFIENLNSASGSVDVPRAVAASMAMLNSTTNRDAEQILMLLGDTGPGELPSETAQSTSQLLASLRQWATTRPRRRVLGLDAGTPSHRQQSDPQRQFFKAIGKSNDKSSVGYHAQDIMKVLFETAFRANGE